MNAEIVLRLLSLAVQVGLPVEQEIEAAIHEHWGKDHIQQLAKGAEHLAIVADTIAKAAGAKVQAVMPGQPAPPPPGTPTPDTSSAQE